MLQHILVHASGRLSYRRAIPVELRPFVLGKKSEHKVSLGPEDDPDFLKNYDKAAKDYERLVGMARRKLEGAFDVLNAPRVARLGEVFRSESLEADDEARWSPHERALFENVRAQLDAQGLASPLNWQGDPRRRWADKTRESLETMLHVYRDLSAIGDLEGIVTMWRDEAVQLVEAQGLIVDPAADDQLERLCRALHQVGIEVTASALRALAL